MTRVVHHSFVRRHLGIGRKAAEKKGFQSKLKLGVGVWSPMKEQLRLSQLCLVSTGTGDKAPRKTLFFLRGMVSLLAVAVVTHAHTYERTHARTHTLARASHSHLGVPLCVDIRPYATSVHTLSPVSP